MDQFAQIAANGIGGRAHLLENPAPIPHKQLDCLLQPTQDAPISVAPHMDDPAALKEALAALRQQMLPYMQDLAPALAPKKQRFEIHSFLRDGVEVAIPEYEGPCGPAKKTYVTELELPALQAGELAWVHFEGADYRAVVTVNGTFVGEHVGFFSPFEFNITDVVKPGKNTLQVELYNDYVYHGHGAVGSKQRMYGDKLYAATGLGWDDPAEGWHHCPPGMGIFNSVYVEIRNAVHITDLYVRPMDQKAQLWIELYSDSYYPVPVEISYSVYGQNFRETVFENRTYVPETVHTVGLGDSLTEAAVKDILGKGTPLPLRHGKNVYKITFPMENPRLWDLDTPWLYQLQASVSVDGVVTDNGTLQFGMRSFTQDLENEERKGKFYLNGRPIRLRGANTMGFEQQDVLRGDMDQLIDDILLAKLCNMNFLRLTQRPVQDKIYEYCDKLGLMLQNDLPLFGCMRRFHVAMGIGQAEEMERLIRSHPCNVIVSYINEPFPNADNAPHRHLERHELEQFFSCCDMVIRMSNPDRVIKHVDGDYDPPTEGMPDNHCYPMWYNGHGIDIGLLHRGYWMPVKPGWYYGCGEYGAEGLDSLEVIREMYPADWIQEPFDPNRIVGAQTGSFHYFFYDTQDTMEDWVDKSQTFQAFATKIMTEAFRRDDRMISNAIHLFIDAWPSGWMKTIMDCRRNPKKAFFAYRDALEPVLLSLRTDRFTYTAGEQIRVEAYLCNDTAVQKQYTVVFELYDSQGNLVKKAQLPADSGVCCARYVADACFAAETPLDREEFLLKAVLLDEDGNALTYAQQAVTVFQDVEIPENDNVVLITSLTPGTHEIAGETVTVKECGMLPLHFASRNTGHSAVAQFQERDFSYWYNAQEDRITPLLYTTFTAPGFTPILTSGNMDDTGKWVQTLAAAEKVVDGKRYVICQLELRTENPVAKRFLRELYK